MDHRDKLLQLVKEKGPLLPSQINKELNTNVLFASAMLSEMVDTKKLRLTSLKIGGSPLYYCPGQEEKLEDFSNKLNEKDSRTFSLLHEKKVMRDKDQEPLIRVSLREIKDFAVPLQVTVREKKELFWKYYLVHDDEAEKLIKDYLEKHNYLEPKKEKQTEIPKEQEKKEEKKEEIKEEKKELPKKEAQTTIQEKVQERTQETIVQHETIVQKEEVKEQENEIKEEIGNADIKEISDKDLQYSYSYSFSPAEKEKAEEKEESPYPEDEFFERIKNLFDTEGIKIEEFNLVRKGSEYDFQVVIPSPVGGLRYFCKARSKKKLNDGDVSAAFVAGQMERLPVLLIIDGEMTNKAAEMIEKDFKSMVIKNIS